MTRMSAASAVLPAVFWLAGGLRLPAKRGSRVQRALCGALFCFAAALTLHLPPVYVGVDKALGVANFADLGEDILAVLGAALLLDVSREIANPARKRRARRRTYGLAAVAILSSTVLFATASVPREVVNFGQAYGGVPQVAAYCMIDIAYFEICLLEFTRLSLAYSRRVPCRSTRVGLWLVGAGATMGVVYSVVLFVELSAELAVPRSAIVSDSANLGRALLMLGGIVVGLGLLIPGAAGAAARARRRIAAASALWQLRPVWLCATDAVPHVVLGERPSIVSDLMGPRPEFRLLGRMVEVRDAMLALRPYVSGERVAAAQAAASRRHPPGVSRSAAESALWLRSAISAKRAGARPVAPPVGTLPAEDVDEHLFARALAAEWAVSAGGHDASALQGVD